jgi:two-component system sensor histidine kinase/response regulator
MINPSLKEANILIVDDQEANVDVLFGFLEMQGYENIVTTTDPREVADLLPSFKPDLILLDLTMPFLNGFEVMEQLRGMIPENVFLPILILTADITTESKIRALSGGASDFLTKPFDLLEVGLRIKNLLYTSYLNQLLMNQNAVLDEKVRERTHELVRKNVELDAAREKAESSERLKTSFINNISHEIRTPLNGILGFGQILTDPYLKEEEKAEYLHIMNESSERLISTVTNFMEISIISSGNQEVFKAEFKPEFVLNDLKGHFKTICDRKNINLSVSLPPEAGSQKIYTDKELLFKILRHLLDNAIKFTDVGGFIILGFEVRESEFLFYVKDNGKGISEEGKKSIFKRFMQEDNSYTRGYEGCGIGLSISTGLIELLGGTIWVDSEKGKGSTFFFTVPILQFTSPAKELVIPTAADGNTKTILVAEDDDINFVYLNILLKHKMIQVLHASDGLEAIEMCKEHPEICAILIDLKMPRMDGFEAASRIREMRTDLPILALTAYSGADDKQRALDAGCDEFITKPIKKELLFERLAKHGVVISN